MQSLRQSEIQGKGKKQINTYICKYLCNVEMGNSNTGATEEEVEEIENEEKVEILPVRKIVGNITLPDSIENANKIWLKILKYMNLKTLLRLLQSCLIKQLCKSYKNKAFQRSVEMAIMTLKKDCIDELNHAYVTEFSHATISYGVMPPTLKVKSTLCFNNSLTQSKCPFKHAQCIGL